MVAERDGQGFIPGVYNYCDRWCERCPFASRYRVYATEMALRIDAAERLARLAGPLLTAVEARVTGGGQEAEVFRDPLEVVARYGYFVAAKARRALSGRDHPPILDDDGRPFPSDLETIIIRDVALSVLSSQPHHLGISALQRAV